MHVLYSFPYRLGKTGIGMIAWQHINWLSGFGISVTVFCASIEKTLPPHVDVKQNIGTGIFHIPLRVLGPMMGPRLHDLQVSLYLRTTRKPIDLFHGWPLGSEKSLTAASSKGIVTILENCNSHIERIEGLLRKEYSSLGMSRTHHVVGNRDWINRQKREYEVADFLACPSDFVRYSFLERAFPSEKLLQTQYGFDESVITFGEQEQISNFRAIFIAHGEPRKGLHYLLAAWNKANLPNGSQLSIVGLMEPAYTRSLRDLINRDSVRFLGFAKNPVQLLRTSHVLVLPSVEEGSALVTYEARGAGCVVLASTACGAYGQSGEGLLLHQPGDVETLSRQLESVAYDRSKYLHIREKGQILSKSLTWEQAGRHLASTYKDLLENRSKRLAGFGI